MMGELTSETIETIWHCRREIENSKKLLEDLADAERWGAEKDAPNLKDAFGRQRYFEFGIPSGHNSHRLYRVSPSLAKYVIEAHIAQKQKELAEANIKARMELAGLVPQLSNPENIAGVE